jgi:hypothetical protein
MTFCHNPRNYVPKAISIKRKIITREEEIGIVASRG